MTRKDEILQALETARDSAWYADGETHRVADDGWVPGWALASAKVGGSEGLRRLRELREEGHPIEMRFRPGSHVAEYRLPPRVTKPVQTELF